MSDDDHVRYERALANVLLAADPIVARAALAAEERALLAALADDGLRICGLLVARLRFERLRHGSRAAADRFERDPREFTRAFKRYHASVPPTACFPPEEARAFEEWRASEGIRPA
jgi:hypothetical protein